MRFKTANGLEITISNGNILEQTTDAIIYGQTDPPLFQNGLAKSLMNILSESTFKFCQGQFFDIKVFDHVVSTLPNGIHIVHFVLPPNIHLEEQAARMENSLGDILLGMDQHNIICVSISLLGTYNLSSLPGKHAMARSIIYVLTSIKQLTNLKYVILMENETQNILLLKKLCQFWTEKGLLTRIRPTAPLRSISGEDSLEIKKSKSSVQNLMSTCAQCKAIRGDGSERMKCGHYLCRECSKLSQYNPRANCKGTYSYQQPPGTMRHYYNNDIDCSGYENKGTIIIEYIFPNGTQQNCHPNPGRIFVGCKYITFLPNNDEGLIALNIFKRAWDLGILFKIQSTANDEINYVTWNIIKQKTSLYGGADKLVFFSHNYSF